MNFPDNFLKCVKIINENNYNYGNEILYQKCGFSCLPSPEVKNDTRFSSAIWLIGKSYSADPTRSAAKNTFSNQGLGSSFESIAKKVHSRTEYEVFYEGLKALSENSYTYEYDLCQKDIDLLEKSVSLVAQLNMMVKNAMEAIAKEKAKTDSSIKETNSDNVVSFCSKFLHFMFPHIFFITDSYSYTGGVALFSGTADRTLCVSNDPSQNAIVDNSVRSYFNTNYTLPKPSKEEFSKEPILSYYKHCLRAYRLACFFHGKDQACALQIKNNPDSAYMPRLVDSVLMRIQPIKAKLEGENHGK